MVISNTVYATVTCITVVTLLELYFFHKVLSVLPLSTLVFTTGSIQYFIGNNSSNTYNHSRCLVIRNHKFVAACAVYILYLSTLTKFNILFYAVHTVMVLWLLFQRILL